jgi:hypothetical protein
LRVAKYTDSELWVKDELERLFWIEIAKRKSRIVDREAFDSLLDLRQEISRWFDDQTSGLPEPFEEGVESFWQRVQFGTNHWPFAIPNEFEDLVVQSLALFGAQGWDLAQRLPHHRGFSLADFSVVSNLVDLHAWWTYITSGAGRKSLNAKGLFSSGGEPRLVAATEELHFAGQERPTVSIGEKVMTTVFISNPVRIPRRIVRQKVRSWTTDENEITVDGSLLTQRLVLDFDLSKPMPSMREVELAVRHAFNAQRRKRWDEMIASGIITDPTLLDDAELRSEDWTRLYLPPVEEHQLMQTQASVLPIIFGLHGFDLMQAGLSKAAATRQILKDLSTPDDTQLYTERRVGYGIKSVLDRIESYESQLLPWND